LGPYFQGKWGFGRSWFLREFPPDLLPKNKPLAAQHSLEGGRGGPGKCGTGVFWKEVIACTRSEEE
jgi:hypothetical protein